MSDLATLARAFGDADPVDRLPEPQRRKDIRQAAGISQRTAAALVGATDETFRMWERGARDPQLARVRSYRKFISMCERMIGGA